MKNSTRLLPLLLIPFLLFQSCTKNENEDFQVYDLKGQNSKGNEIYIPDGNFLNTLLNTNCVDANGDGEGDFNADSNNDGILQKNELNSIENLILKFNYGSPIKYVDLTGIENFGNVKSLKISGTIDYIQVDNVLNSENLSYDFTSLRKLEYLKISYLGTEYFDNINVSGLNKLTEIDLSQNRPMDYYTERNKFLNINMEGCSNLKSLNITNSFINIDFCQIPSLEKLNMFYLEGGEPDVFDFHCLVNLKWLDISENRINKLILKNSSVLETLICQDIGSEDEYINYPFPNYLCIDDLQLEWEQVATMIGPDNIVTTDCTF